MEKVADKVSQLVKRNSKEKLTENIPDSPLPPFKPIPKIQLKRESSLPRIEVDRPATPVGPLASSSPTILANRSSIRLMLASASLLAIATFSLFASLLRLLFSSRRFASSGSRTSFLTENQSRTGHIWVEWKD